MAPLLGSMLSLVLASPVGDAPSAVTAPAPTLELGAAEHRTSPPEAGPAHHGTPSAPPSVAESDEPRIASAPAAEAPAEVAGGGADGPLVAPPMAPLEEDEWDGWADEDEGDGGAEPFDLQPPAPGSAEQPQSSSRAGGAPRTVRRRSPVLWGRNWLTVGVTAASNAFGLGIGGTHFVVPWVGFGLDVEDVVIAHNGVYNLFQVTPKVVLLATPRHRVTPVVRAGFGGAFFSGGLGAYGRWVTGGGVMIAIGEHMSLGAGVDVEGLTPRDRYARNFECRLSQTYCSLGVAPWGSIGFRG